MHAGAASAGGRILDLRAIGQQRSQRAIWADPPLDFRSFDSAQSSGCEALCSQFVKPAMAAPISVALSTLMMS